MLSPFIRVYFCPMIVLPLFDGPMIVRRVVVWVNIKASNIIACPITNCYNCIVCIVANHCPIACCPHCQLSRVSRIVWRVRCTNHNDQYQSKFFSLTQKKKKKKKKKNKDSRYGSMNPPSRSGKHGKRGGGADRAINGLPPGVTMARDGVG